MAVAVKTVSGGCCPISYTTLGMIETNVYVIDDGADGVIVCDPGDFADDIMSVVGQRHVSAIFVTHRHFDHIGALAQLKAATGAPIYASALDAPGIANPEALFGVQAEGCPVDVELSDGDKISVGAQTWAFLHTPGHTQGCGCFLLEPDASAIPEGAPVLLSGDTLFFSGFGRVDLPGGNMEQMSRSLFRLGQLDGRTIVLPGHGETTTISAEKDETIAFFGRED